MKKDIIAMLLAGGVGSRLNILVSKRAKPALPFGAIYRIIDFTLSNIGNSNIDVVGVLTQYKPLSLMEHIDGGRPWDLFGRTRLVEVLPPKTGEEISDWYKGTSDAIFQNIGFIEDYSPDLVLVVSGDHIYSMDYNKIIAFHCAHKANATVSLIRVPHENIGNFGIAEIDRAGRITSWVEKPKTARSNLASMGIYVFNTKTLIKTIIEASKAGGNDFAQDVIPSMIRKQRVHGFIFEDYWRDVGTIHSYWRTNMEMLDPESGLKIKDWRIKTNLSTKGEIGDRPPAYIGRTANIVNSMVARGCIIEGDITNCILSPGVRVARKARVVDSVIFHDTTIDEESLVQCCIIDKQVSVGASARIGIGESIPNKRFPSHLSTGISIIGKLAKVAPGLTIGRNCVISPDARLTTKQHRNIPSGSTI
jgi:glucose-1-phosphate adenylyltransferase